MGEDNRVQVLALARDTAPSDGQWMPRNTRETLPYSCVLFHGNTSFLNFKMYLLIYLCIRKHIFRSEDKLVGVNAILPPHGPRDQTQAG